MSEAAVPQGKFMVNPYRDWAEAQGVPIVEDFGLDLLAIETAPWDHFGVDGAIAHVKGRGDFMTVFVLAAAGTLTDPVSTFFMESSYTLAKGRNVVNTIIVDFRSLDTLAEVAVLAIAGFGVYALLKLRTRQRDVDREGEA